MINDDTVKLLRECSSGIRMGIDSIDEVWSKVKSPKLKKSLDHCKRTHGELLCETEYLLAKYGDDGREPSLIAKGMSRLKTGARLSLDCSDETVAELIFDGCNMGVKSLSRYLNQYAAADEASKDVAKRLIESEMRLCDDMRAFL